MTLNEKAAERESGAAEPDRIESLVPDSTDFADKSQEAPQTNAFLIKPKTLGAKNLLMAHRENLKAQCRADWQGALYNRFDKLSYPFAIYAEKKDAFLSFVSNLNPPITLDQIDLVPHEIPPLNLKAAKRLDLKAKEDRNEADNLEMRKKLEIDKIEDEFLTGEFTGEERNARLAKIEQEFTKGRIEELRLSANQNEAAAIKIAVDGEKKKHAESELPWAGIEIPYGYQLDKTGVWKLPFSLDDDKNSEKKSDKEEKKTKICDPIWVHARSRDFSNKRSGLLLRGIDLDAKETEICIERKNLHAHGNPIAQELADSNMRIVPGREKDLSKYLSDFKTDKTYRSVASLGWLENSLGSLLYVSKNRVFKSTNCDLNEEVIFQAQASSKGASLLECRGTLEGWKTHIGEPCKGNDMPIFLQSVSLSGFLVKHADTGSYGFHLGGKTTLGKTTATQTGASTIACGADPAYSSQVSIMKRWLTTANALESLATQSNDSALFLDEIGQCPGSDLDKTIYNIFGGRGKERLSPDSQHKKTREWCTVLISSGEVTFSERLKQTNSKTPAGLFVRFIDLHLEDVFTDYHGKNPKEFVDTLKADCGRHFGTVGSAFIEKLVDVYKTSQSLRDAIATGCRAIAAEIRQELDLSDLSPEHTRVLKLFSLAALAGAWAAEWDIFPYSQEDVLSASANIFRKWRDGNKKQTEDVLCISAIRDFFIKKRESAFRPQYLRGDDSKRYAEVYGYTTEEGKFFLTKDGLLQAIGSLPIKAALKHLSSKGYLIREEEDRYESKKTIEGLGQTRVYVISEKICEFDGEGR